MSSQDAAEAVFGSPKHRAQLVLIALWVAQGRFAEAEPLADSLQRGAAKSERADQYRETLVNLHVAVARTWAGLGRHADAQPHFVRSIDLLHAANPAHAWLAEIRAHYAASLRARGEPAAACQQLALAGAALAEQALAGPQFRHLVQAQASRGGCGPGRQSAAVSGSSDLIRLSRQQHHFGRRAS